MINFYSEAPVLTSRNLKLRPWCDADLSRFADMGADPDVMRYFPGLMTRAQSDAFVEELQNRFRKWGFSYWAVEDMKGEFCGFVGLSRPRFMQCVEIGWRLHKTAWGRGYATEAASMVLAYGFEHCGLKEIISFAPQVNGPSVRVMERLGMHHDEAGDFDHPSLPIDSPLKRCVLYHLTAEQFKQRT